MTRLEERARASVADFRAREIMKSSRAFAVRRIWVSDGFKWSIKRATK